jgi:hypothetical protein
MSVDNLTCETCGEVFKDTATYWRHVGEAHRPDASLEPPEAEAEPAGNRAQRRAADQAERGQQPAQKRRPADAPRTEEPTGEVVHESGASGAPSGGQQDGRQGDQQGIRY